MTFGRCAHPVFPRGWRYCDDGARIVGWALCDGRPHCPMGEDEDDANCLALDTGFHCGDSQIPRRAVCDQVVDCQDGADEATCPAFVCHDGNGAVPSSARCDGSVECADESDEWNCLVP